MRCGWKPVTISYSLYVDCPEMAFYAPKSYVIWEVASMNMKDLTSILTLLLVVVGGVFLADFLKSQGMKFGNNG